MRGTFLTSFIFYMLEIIFASKLTFTNKHLSSALLHKRYWKDNNKISLNFVTNGNDGTILSAKNVYSEPMHIRIMRHKVKVFLANKLQVIHGLESITVKESVWQNIMLKEHKSGIEIHIGNLVTVLPLYRQRKWLIENWEDVILGANNPESNTYEEGYDDARAQSIVGCIEIKTTSNKSPIESQKATLEGCVDACDLQSCENGGRCINKYEYAYCDCKGTGHEGYSCEIQSDAISLDGSSFIEVHDIDDIAMLKQDYIIRFKASQNEGVLSMIKFPNEWILIEIASGKILVTSKTYSGSSVTMNIGENVNDNRWHRLKLQKQYDVISVNIDDDIVAKAITSDNQHVTQIDGTVSKHDETTKIFYGGMPNEKQFQEISKNKRNFVGCFQHLYHGNKDAVSKVLYSHVDEYTVHGRIKKCTQR